jgi:polyisoprenoid-binding protein YceI
MSPGLSNSSHGRGCRLVLMCALIACVPPAVAAAADEHEAISKLSLDAERSRADFEVKVLWLIGVHGRFGRVRGTVTLDRIHASVVADAQIDVNAITMRNRSYEDWVRSDEFFAVRQYPQIHFVSNAFPIERLRSGGEITGTLSLRGIDRPVTMQIESSDCPDAIASDCPVEASGTIRRSEFGMKSRRGTLSDKVDLQFSIYLAAAIPAPDHAK